MQSRNNGMRYEVIEKLAVSLTRPGRQGLNLNKPV